MNTQPKDNKDNMEQSLKKTLDTVMPMVILAASLQVAQGMTVALIEQDAEKELGRPLTMQEREFCREEYERKKAWDWLRMLSEIYDRRSAGEEVIRRIVWR